MSEAGQARYKLFGMDAITLSIIFGICLITWGLFATYFSGSNSMTSLIPTFLGLPILAFSLLSRVVPKKEKLLMHITIIFGGICILGGLDLIRVMFSGGLFSNFWADISKFVMLLGGIFYCFICVQHFRFVRKLKQATR